MKKVLGKGLEALLGDVDFNIKNNSSTSDIILISIDRITPNPYQPRMFFEEIALEKMSQSILEDGLLQPILVRRDHHNQENFLLISGERRLRASKIANLTEIPAIVREDLDDMAMMKIALIENIQREDLSIIEEAKMYDLMKKKLKLTQDQLSELIGKSRSAISNTLRLLNLPLIVQNNLIHHKIEEGHARALLGLNSEKEIIKIQNKILEEKLTVRAVEQLVREIKKKPLKKKIKKDEAIIQTDGGYFCIKKLKNQSKKLEIYLKTPLLEEELINKIKEWMKALQS